MRVPSRVQLAAERAAAHDALLRPLRHQTAAAECDGQSAPSDGQSAPSSSAKPCEAAVESEANAVTSVQPPMSPDLQQRIRQLAVQPLPSSDGPVGPARRACAPGQAALLASLTAQPAVKFEAADQAASAPSSTVKTQPGVETQPGAEAQLPIPPTSATAAAASVASHQSAADQKAQKAEAPASSEALRLLLARYSARDGDCTARAELAHAAWRYATTRASC